MATNTTLSRSVQKKHAPTFLLRLAVVLMGLMVLGLCVLIMPAVFREWSKAYPEAAIFRWPVLVGLAMTAIAFFSGMFQTLKLLSFVDKNTAFNQASVKALGVMKYNAVVIAGVYTLGLPVAYQIAQHEDAPGLIVLCMLCVFASAVVFLLAAVLQRLLQSAIELKAEHDLTV